MDTIKKLKEFILPVEIDFFKRLQEQSVLCKNIIDELYKIHIAQGSSSVALLKTMIRDAETVRRENLKELEQVFITPVDKESISRAYINLDWVIMSIKHLQVELEIYQIDDLKEYKAIFDFLIEEINHVTSGFKMLNRSKKKQSWQDHKIIHCDNELIKEYARQVSILLESDDIKKIITRKEILNQLKEVSKRIRLCANDLDDIMFKMI